MILVFNRVWAEEYFFSFSILQKALTYPNNGERKKAI